jgi:hypothetical protein
VLTFEFSALNYRAPENRYRYTGRVRYRWNEVGSDKRRVTYNRDPGVYVFPCAWSNDDGVGTKPGPRFGLIIPVVGSGCYRD